MASKKAKQWLASIGQPILEKPHTSLELSNFSAGSGKGRYSMPYHVIRMDSRYGDSKTTVAWETSLKSARNVVSALKLADPKDGNGSSGAEYCRNRYFTYYIRDIRNGRIYK